MKTSILNFIFALILLVVPLQNLIASENNNHYRLDAGDQVKLTVFGHQDLSGEFVVSQSGYLSLPLIIAVKVVGLTLDEVVTAIIAKLKPDYLLNPKVNVEVLNFRPFYIIGEVNNPGSYPYVSGMTVINAVAMAGGYTYRAKKSETAITRENKSGKENKLATINTIILPGDIIEIPERFF